MEVLGCEIFCAAPFGVVVLEPTTLEVLYANPAYLRFLDEPYRSGGIEGERLTDFIPEAEQHGIIEMFRQVAETGEPFASSSYSYGGFSRGQTYWQGSVYRLDEETARLVLIIDDATEVTGSASPKTQQPLDEQDFSWRLLDTLPIPVAYVDRELVVRRCGIAVSHAIGMPRSEIIGQSVEALLGEKSEATAVLREAVAAGASRQVRITHPDAASHERHWAVTFVPDYVHGVQAGVVAAAFDLTELIVSQARVAESEQMYRSIGELLPYGTWTADSSGAMTYLSDSFVGMTGRDAGSLMGWGWLDLLPTDDDRRQALGDWHRTAAEGVLRDSKHTVRASDGSYRTVLCRGVALNDAKSPAKWVGVHVDITEEERRRGFNEALTNVKDFLVSALDTGELLGRVGEALLSPTGADQALVIEQTDTGWLVDHAAGEGMAFAPTDTFSREEMPLAQTAYESGEIQISVNALADERLNSEKARADGLQSLVIVPIKRHGTVLCLMALVYRTARVNADSPLMHFLSQLCNSLDLALQAAGVHEHQRQISETLQESLLTMPESLPNVDMARVYQPAAEEDRIGGDFYDAFEIKGSRIALVIGDIAGSGLEAAALTALAKNSLRAHLIDGQSPGRALTKTNTVLYTFTEEDEFATAFVAVIDPRKGTLCFATAGHPRPLGSTGQNGVEPRVIDGSGLLLGAFADTEYEDFTCALREGETLLLYTDGVIEARRGSDLYGEERLTAFLGSAGEHTPSELLQLVLDDVRLFAGGDFDDDVAMLAIRPRTARPRKVGDQQSLELGP